MARFIQNGNAIDFTAAADISGGDVVSSGNILGVAVSDIKSGKTGALSLRGVYAIPKASATTFAVGDAVYWDATTSLAVTTGTIVFGVAIDAAASGETIVVARLSPSVPVSTANAPSSSSSSSSSESSESSST